MTLGEWLASRAVQPPQALRVRIEGALGDATSQGADDATDICMAAAERIVRDVLRHDCTSRGSALDLLTADALMTYAFEAAGDAPSALGQKAAEAMRRIASLGALAPEGATA